MIEYFQQDLGVNDANVTFSVDEDYSKYRKVICEDLDKKLEENSGRNYLIIYVFGGHAI